MNADERNTDIEQKITKILHTHNAYSIRTFNCIPDLVSLINQEVAEMPTEKDINNSNPYPEDVFLPISDETLKKVADYLKWGGYSPDALFGHWGRIVWNNCCEWFRNRMSKPNKEVEEPCPHSNWDWIIKGASKRKWCYDCKTYIEGEK